MVSPRVWRRILLANFRELRVARVLVERGHGIQECARGEYRKRKDRDRSCDALS
jgi:hypothetical protein